MARSSSGRSPRSTTSSTDGWWAGSGSLGLDGVLVWEAWTFKVVEQAIQARMYELAKV
jgi:hypothetical protein